MLFEQVYIIKMVLNDSLTDPYLLEASHIPIVSTDVSSFESCGVGESLEEVFSRASAIKSIVMSAPDMEADKEEIELLIDEADGLMEMNPVDFMQPGNSERMDRLQDQLDKSCVNCGQKLKQWKNNYSTTVDATVVTSLQTAVTKLKQDVLAYKRELVAKKQDFPSNPLSSSPEWTSSLSTSVTVLLLTRVVDCS